MGKHICFQAIFIFIFLVLSGCSARPGLRGGGGMSAVALPGCEHLLEESAYCMALVAEEGLSPAMIGLDSGEVCQTKIRLQQVDVSHDASLAWIGKYLYTCNGRNLVRISPTDGEETVLDLPCKVIATDGDKFFVLFSPLGGAWDKVRVYSSYRDLKSNHYELEFETKLSGHLLAADDGMVYSSWFSSDQIERSAIGETEKELIELEGFDDPISGMEVLGASELLIAPGHGNPGEGLQFFDAETGHYLRSSLWKISMRV